MKALWDPQDDWFSGSVTCFGFRRHACNADPGAWVCTVVWCGVLTVNIRSVVDDFGSLVPVEVVK